MRLDEEEKSKQLESLVEYAMSFYDYDLVSKVQEAKKMEGKPKPVEEKEEGEFDFLKQAAQILGAEIPKETESQQDLTDEQKAAEWAKNYRTEQFDGFELGNVEKLSTRSQINKN